MKINELYRDGDFDISIEIFPPKDPAGDVPLYRAVGRLAEHSPSFISCTYGAGGSTRGRTVDICKKIQSDYNITATAHFTCVGATEEELVEWLISAQDAGIENVLALRGDLPQDDGPGFVQGGLKYANELVSLIKKNFPNLGIGVAGYPEKHLEAPDLETDLQNLKNKVDAGADAVYTQLFYDNGKFFEFYEKYQALGIEVPLIPGIMPINDFERMQRITKMCGASFPKDLANRLEKVKNDRAAQLDIGVDHATKQIEELKDQGIRGVHLYALNLSKACRRILSNLGR